MFLAWFIANKKIPRGKRVDICNYFQQNLFGNQVRENGYHGDEALR
ncbi:unnamed protein product [Brassica oleracea]